MNTITVKLQNGTEVTATTEEWVGAILCILPPGLRDSVIARAGKQAKTELAVPRSAKNGSGLVVLS